MGFAVPLLADNFLTKLINMALPMKIVFAAVATGLLVLGIHDCITNFEENGCEMTWMFEYPTYLVRNLMHMHIQQCY